MRLPQRVPWVSLAELEFVHDAIYIHEEHDAAIDRLAAWKFGGSLPFALEATLAFLVALRVDKEPSNPRSSLFVRHGYAAAIVRFVNGLVDPLQSGWYARSIASIASQIDLPLYFVELRHAATHEELPSLPVLRQAAQDVTSSFSVALSI